MWRVRAPARAAGAAPARRRAGGAAWRAARWQQAGCRRRHRRWWQRRADLACTGARRPARCRRRSRPVQRSPRPGLQAAGTARAAAARPPARVAVAGSRQRPGCTRPPACRRADAAAPPLRRRPATAASALRRRLGRSSARGRGRAPAWRGGLGARLRSADGVRWPYQSNRAPALIHKALIAIKKGADASNSRSPRPNGRPLRCRHQRRARSPADALACHRAGAEALARTPVTPRCRQRPAAPAPAARQASIASPSGGADGAGRAR